MKNNMKILLFYVILISVIITTTAMVLGGATPEKTHYSDIVRYFNDEQVRSFTITGDNTIVLNTVSGDIIEYKLRDYQLFMLSYGELIDSQLADNVIEGYDIEEPFTLPFWATYLIYGFLLFVLIMVFIFITNKSAGGARGGRINSFGKSRIRLADEKSKVTFDDVAGADEEKEELREVVDFLKQPGKYAKLGAKIPHGVLLVGPPGTGKTLLAKAVAGEAGVPFFSLSGSDFVELYVGVGASRVRDLFDSARKHPASIIFIDEIDAVGRHRGAGLGGGHDEREQTLNQLLVEMDGFEKHSGIIVIAATNRPDILDPALLRPGRFDRQVTVNYPDIRGRLDILKVHAKGKPMEEDVDLEVIAQTTSGFTGADLANLLNEAALLAARRKKQLIGMNDIEDAIIKCAVGPQKKNKKINEHERRLTAFHEAGHAITTHFLTPESPVHQISIISSGNAGGYTLSFPREDRYYSSKLEMENSIVTLLGGRVAESLVMGDISTGASNDIQRATNIARNMVMKYGMSDELGPIVYGGEHSSDEIFLGRDFSNSKNYSETTAALIDKEIKRIITEAYNKARATLEAHNDKLSFVAEFLVKYETMDEGQFEAAMNGAPTFEELEAMISEKRKKSALENERAKCEQDSESNTDTEIKTDSNESNASVDE